MRILGEPIFAKGPDGQLKSRIGTMFFRTPGLVTQRGVHAMQRVLWLKTVNEELAAAGKAPLTPEEEEAELSESVDLIFTEDLVLIRPDPERMELALKADEELQKIVSKVRIRYLNTSSAKVRMALCSRGENWRMARHPISQEDMTELIERSRVAIACEPIYYYNRLTGTRFITASGYEQVEKLSDEAFRRQVEEVVTGLSKRNRLGQLEVDVFPPSTPVEIKKALKQLPVAELNNVELRRALQKIDADWRMSLPAELREERVENYEWRNTMCHALTRAPNETAAEEQDLVSGIAPEFYRQIEWLPGARIDRGEVVFDSVYDEASRTQDPELLALCDNRVKSFLFNTTRLFGQVTYMNIGRIANSLARHPVEGNRRGNAYIMQYAVEDEKEPRVLMIRLQKWGVAEHLDEGKDLLQSIIEADEYSDYILDRRLMCRQLGMNLPKRLGYGHFTEKYRGTNQYNGVAVRTGYFVRNYISGVASDKVPLAKLRNPAWAQKFAFLMGAAAAVDLLVGRRSSVTKELLFDKNYEVVKVGADGLPAEIAVTDHAGSFVNYEHPLVDYVAQYAGFARRREQYVTEFPQFVEAYVEGFRRRLVEVKSAYLSRQAAFDELFADRPYDTNGSGAYRWACILRRLAVADPDSLADLLRKAIQC